jgi:hypothetical protein
MLMQSGLDKSTQGLSNTHYDVYIFTKTLTKKIGHHSIFDQPLVCLDSFSTWVVTWFDFWMRKQI